MSRFQDAVCLEIFTAVKISRISRFQCNCNFEISTLFQDIQDFKMRVVLYYSKNSRISRFQDERRLELLQVLQDFKTTAILNYFKISRRRGDLIDFMFLFDN